MKKRFFNYITAFILALPAIGMIAWTQIYTQEYFYGIHLLAALVFLTAAVTLSIPPLRPHWFRVEWWRMVLFFLLALIAAWLVAMGAMLFLYLTPACIGQNNGDGTNDLTQCIVQAGLIGITYSYTILHGCVIAAFVAGLLMKGIAPVHSDSEES